MAGIIAHVEDVQLGVKQLLKACDAIVGQVIAMLISKSSRLFKLWIEILIRQHIEAWTWATKISWSWRYKLMLAAGTIGALL